MVVALAIGLGGFVGAILRHGLSLAFQRLAPGAFPLGTLAVNVLGCLAAGWLLRYFSERPSFDAVRRAFWMVGLLGALTTFSAFGVETLVLVREGRTALALGSVVAHLALALGAVAAGWHLAGRLA